MKTNPDIVELIHGEIDGVNSGAQSAELRQVLASDPDAQQEFLDLQKLCTALEAIEDVPPPADLRPNILRAVRLSRPVTPPGLVHRLRAAWPTGHGGLRYAYAAAAGFFIALVLVRVADLGGAPEGTPADLVGTLASRSASSAAAVGEVRLTSPGVDGLARLTHLDAGYAVEFSFEAQGPVRVVVSFDPAEVGFRGFAQDPEVLQGLELFERSLSWTQAGTRRTAVLFAPAAGHGSSIHVVVSRPGETEGKAVITLPGQG